MQKRLSHEVIRVVAAFAFLALPLCAQNSDYDQPYRPQVHFSPEEHWTNDPNGLVFFQGEYHLFFQYNPFGDQWGHMSWGHAVSTDLLHWHELPVAIPEDDGVMIFTGSIVVDHRTPAASAPQGECLVAVYTGQTATLRKASAKPRTLPYSLDKGRTWTQYPGNPVLDLHMADFRDPSVSWDPIAHHWIMAVFAAQRTQGPLLLLPRPEAVDAAQRLRPAGDVDGDWECPDLLHIPSSNGGRTHVGAEGRPQPGRPQGGSGEQYFLGDFDGKNFTVSPRLRGAHGWTNYGKDDYCAISFNSLPKDQKPILLGWMSNWQYAAKLPTSPWRGQMSLPRRLSYLSDSAGLALKQEPVVAPLRGKNYELSALSINSSALYGSGQTIQPPFEIRIQFGHPAEPVFGLKIYSDQQHWIEVAFDTNKKEFYIDRTHSGAAVSPDFPVRTAAPLVTTRPYDLTLIVDRSSVEAFAQDGTIAMTDLVFPVSNNLQIQIFPDDAKPIQSEGQLWELKSIW